MTSDEAIETESIQVKPRSPWTAVFGWSGVFLLRWLLGCGIWGAAVFFAQSFILTRTHPEVSVLGEAPSWYIAVIWGLPFIAIASLVFLPLWQRREKTSFRGQRIAIEAVHKLLLPAIALQVYAAMTGGAGIGVVNYLLAGCITFLATLALDEGRARQFLLLIVAGSHGISLWTTVFLIGRPFIEMNKELKLASWLGALPVVIMMALLFLRCRRNLEGQAGA
jgi:hypothetical protein